MVPAKITMMFVLARIGIADVNEEDNVNLLSQRLLVDKRRQAVAHKASNTDQMDAVQNTSKTGRVDGLIHTDEFRDRNAYKITCPVLGALYKKGILKPDNTGRITKTNLEESLQWMGNSYEGALFQGTGIAAYTEDDREQKNGRSRSLHERYLNIFWMDPGQLTSSFFVQHGVSTNIRDSRFDGPNSMTATLKLPEIDSSLTSDFSLDAVANDLADATPEEVARVRNIREERLQYWFEQMDGVLEDNKLYANGLGKLIAKLKTNGDHSGEWSIENQPTFHPGAAGTKENEDAESEWQSTLAFTAFIAMAGRSDTEGGPLYVTLDDLKDFYLDSEFPFEPPKRDFGFMTNDLGLASQLHEENPSLTYSRMIKERVDPGGSWWTKSVKFLTFWMGILFQRIGATDDFGTIRELLLGSQW